MIQSIKNFIKTKPKLYDLLNYFRPINDEIEIWLNNFSKKNNRKINFVQIGANDGLRWDPVRKFVVRDKWNGIFVEPLPPVFKLLKQNYAHITNQNLIFINAAISSEDNESFIIWSFTDKFCSSLSIEDRMNYLRKSSTIKEHVENSISKFDNIDDKIRSYKVTCMSLNTLLTTYWNGDEIDLVVIDAEGHDDIIIHAIDFNNHSPKAILFESHNLSKDRKSCICSYLVENGYSLSNLGGDTVAVINA